MTLRSGDSDSFGYDPNTGRVTQYQHTVNGSSVVGNMTCTGGTLCPSIAYDASTNRINTIGGATVGYDNSGNVTLDHSTVPNHTYQWDAEGRLQSIDSGATASYTYNALGQQVRLSAPSYTWDHLYDAAGQWAGDYGNAWQSEVVHLGGRVLVNYQPSQSYFVHGNQLGSTSMNTDAAGNVAGDILFYPWGQVWKGSSPEWHFGGFDYRDTTANLDPTLFRQYANAQGRWLSPDPMAGNVLNPQSLNRYAYVTNNPTTLTDPLGLQQGDCLRDPACRIESYWGLGNSINPSVGSWDEFDSLRLALVGFQWNIVGYIPGTDVPILSIDPVYQLIFPANAFLDAPRIVWETSDVNRPSAPANNDPCANATLSATGVNIRQNIAVANFTVSVGYAAGSIGGFGNPVGGLAGALYGYAQLVHTGGSQDVKNQPGPGTPQQRVDAGNISFGVTCPFGARFCQFAAGVAQTLSGHPNPNGTLLTGFDTPSDNAGIRVGQAMRKAGCHE